MIVLHHYQLAGLAPCLTSSRRRRVHISPQRNTVRANNARLARLLIRAVYLGCAFCILACVDRPVALRLFVYGGTAAAECVVQFGPFPVAIKPTCRSEKVPTSHRKSFIQVGLLRTAIILDLAVLELSIPPRRELIVFLRNSNRALLFCCNARTHQNSCRMTMKAAMCGVGSSRGLWGSDWLVC